MVYVPDPTESTEVAFAISRRAATAVRRNRCRRRLRAALVDAQRAGRLPHGSYLISVGPDAVEAAQVDLAAILDEVLAELAVRSR